MFLYGRMGGSTRTDVVQQLSAMTGSRRAAVTTFDQAVVAAAPGAGLETVACKAD